MNTDVFIDLLDLWAQGIRIDLICTESGWHCVIRDDHKGGQEIQHTRTGVYFAFPQGAVFNAIKFAKKYLNNPR